MMTDGDGDLSLSSRQAEREPVLSPIDTKSACSCCGGRIRRRTFTATEFLFGTKEPFEYFECGDCASLQINGVPSDLHHHYPPDYLSMIAEDRPIESISYFRRLARAARTDYHIGRATPIGWLIDMIAPNRFQTTWQWFRGCASTKSRILDVGCGVGHLLRSMHEQGFRRLTGIDPFIEQSFAADGLQIIRGELADLDEQFDFIMLHHSLEHLSNALAALCEVRRLLRPRGAVLIRVPVAGTYAERRYGINWIGLDPPRHLFVPSRIGMYELARRTGFFVQRHWFNSTWWTLLTSEAIARGLPPWDREKKVFLDACYFTAAEIEEARQRATILNRREDGDTACFILRRA